MWRHRAVNSRNGARIGVHTTGLPSGEPILLLSSLLADWRSWNDVAGRFPSGVYAITMDLRGHGTSSPSAGDYRLAELAADGINVMDKPAFASDGEGFGKGKVVQGKVCSCDMAS